MKRSKIHEIEKGGLIQHEIDFEMTAKLNIQLLWCRLAGIRGTQVNSSVRMKKTKESFKWLLLSNLIPEIESKAPN